MEGGPVDLDTTLKVYYNCGQFYHSQTEPQIPGITHHKIIFTHCKYVNDARSAANKKCSRHQTTWSAKTGVICFT